MKIRKSTAVWNGSLRDGSGRLQLGSGAFEGEYSYVSRFEEGPGTNPEELIGAAHAGCFTMFLSGQLTREGYTVNTIRTTAAVHLGRDDQGPKITLIELETEAEIPQIEDEAFQTIADRSKQLCPVSRALAATEIHLSARLAG
jgi:lipoyl-dependent peroxiredoxin